MFKQCNVPQMLKGFTRKNLFYKILQLSFWRRSNFEAALLWPFLLKEPKTSTKPSWSWKCSWMFARCQKVSDERPFHRGGGQRGKTESQFSGEPSANNAFATWHRRFGSQNKTLNIIALVVSRFYIQRQKLYLSVSFGPPKLISSSLKQSQKYKTYQFQCHGYNIL